MALFSLLNRLPTGRQAGSAGPWIGSLAIHGALAALLLGSGGVASRPENHGSSPPAIRAVMLSPAAVAQLNAARDPGGDGARQLEQLIAERQQQQQLLDALADETAAYQALSRAYQAEADAYQAEADAPAAPSRVDAAAALTPLAAPPPWGISEAAPVNRVADAELAAAPPAPAPVQASVAEGGNTPVDNPVDNVVDDPIAEGEAAKTEGTTETAAPPLAEPVTADEPALRRAFDPLFRYQQLMAAAIQRYMPADPKLYGRQCVLRLRLARDGTVLAAVAEDGDPPVCVAAERAVLRAGRLPMSDTDEIYAQLAQARITIRPE